MEKETFKIDKQDIVFNSFGELDVEKSNLPWVEFDDKGKMKVNTVILAKYISYGVYKDTGEYIIDYLQVQGEKKLDFYIYNRKKGVWSLVGDDMFKGYVFRFIPSEVRNVKLKAELWSEIVENVNPDRKCYFDDFNSDIDNYINFKDGILDISNKTLLPHTPKLKSTIQIPCKYKDVLESKGYAPVFDKYMDDLCDGKPDYKRLLLEFAGAVVSNISGKKIKKALIMKGLGNTGKSKFRNLVEYLIGIENSCPIQFSQLNDKYDVGYLYGKRLAGHGEAADDVATNLKMFKALTGGDQVSSDRKFKSSINFVFNGLFWYNSNFYIKFGGDRGNWVYDRLIIMEFNNVIPEEKRDVLIEEKMKKEKNGIMYQILQHLYEFVENNLKFHLNSDLPRLLKECKEENSPALQFIESCCVKVNRNSREKTLRSSLYNKYVEWCNYNGNVKRGKQNFFKELDDALSDDDGSFFCNIHGTYYVRKYRFDETLFKKEVNSESYTNMFLQDDDIYELEYGKEALDKKKIIEFEQEKNKQKLKQHQATANYVNKYQNVTTDDCYMPVNPLGDKGKER